MKLRSIERELLEIELITMLIIRIEACEREHFSQDEKIRLLAYMRESKRLLGLD